MSCCSCVRRQETAATMKLKRMRGRQVGEMSGFITKGLWKPEEDALLLAFVNSHGPYAWNTARSIFPGLCRTGKSCRLRYTNQLRPGIRRQPVSPVEEERIMQLHNVFGNQWSRIASHLSGRTDNTIKNVVNMRLKRARRRAASLRSARVNAQMLSGILNGVMGMNFNGNAWNCNDDGHFPPPPPPPQDGMLASSGSGIVSVEEVQSQLQTVTGSLLSVAGPGLDIGMASGINWAALQAAGQLPSVQKSFGGSFTEPELSYFQLCGTSKLEGSSLTSPRHELPTGEDSSTRVGNGVSDLVASLGGLDIAGMASAATAGDVDLLEAVFAGSRDMLVTTSRSSGYNQGTTARSAQVVDDSYLGAILHRSAILEAGYENPAAAAIPGLQTMECHAESHEPTMPVVFGNPAGLLELLMGDGDFATVVCGPDWESMPAATHIEESGFDHSV